MNIPEKKTNRVDIQGFVGRVECMPGTKIIEFYRSPHPTPAFKSAEESSAKTDEAKKRIFKMNPNKRFSTR